MDAWIILTIVAAFLQNIRNGLQKSLSTLLSAEGAAYTRFVYGLPLAIVYWGFLKYFINEEVNWSNSFFMSESIPCWVKQFTWNSPTIWKFGIVSMGTIILIIHLAKR